MNFAMNLRALLFAATLVTLGGCGGESSSDPEPTQPAPAPVTVTIGGTVSGLAGSLVLRNNGSNDLTIASDGAFTFSSALGSGVAFAVSVATQPANETCAVTNGTGTTGATNVTNVGVTCSAVVAAPSALSYPSPQNYVVGAAITPLNPAVTGIATSFGVSPALPAGLVLDTSTGQITGAPAAESAAASYVITASNSGGATTFSLAIAITATTATDFTI